MKAPKYIDKAEIASKVLLMIPIGVAALSVLFFVALYVFRLFASKNAAMMPEDNVAVAALLGLMLGLSVAVILTFILAPIALLVVRGAIEPAPIRRFAEIELIVAVLLILPLWPMLSGLFRDVLFRLF